MVEVIGCGDFEAWYASLPEANQDAVAVVVDLLERHGVLLGDPYSSAIAGATFALRELRVKAGKSPLRVFYAFDVKRRGVLLSGGSKAGISKRLFYRQAIERCERHWRDHARCD